MHQLEYVQFLLPCLANSTNFQVTQTTLPPLGDIISYLCDTDSLVTVFIPSWDLLLPKWPLFFQFTYIKIHSLSCMLLWTYTIFYSPLALKRFSLCFLQSASLTHRASWICQLMVFIKSTSSCHYVLRLLLPFFSLLGLQLNISPSWSVLHFPSSLLFQVSFCVALLTCL